jgi:iron uptake system component EfeO
MTLRRHPTMIATVAGLGCFGLLLLGCGADQGPPEQRAKAAVKSQITAELGNLSDAATRLRAAAPAPDGDGWNDQADMAAVVAMRAEWKKARTAYERIEGAIAVLFQNYDESTDQRYDWFIAEAPDADLFDGQGVTGIHAIERMLWANSQPAEVVAFESTLTGYQAARLPMTQAEATQFRDGLAKRLVDDTTAMKQMFAPLNLDTAAAFRGVIGSLGEQIEKIELAATGEDESRYAQNTLADMRANLEGGQNTYAAFRDWVRSEQGGQALDTDILAGFARVKALYDASSGDSLPPVPDGFDPEVPTAAHLDTPYGRIFEGLSTESDPDQPQSLVAKMTAAADLLGIPRLPE